MFKMNHALPQKRVYLLLQPPRIPVIVNKLIFGIPTHRFSATPFLRSPDP